MAIRRGSRPKTLSAKRRVSDNADHGRRQFQRVSYTPVHRSADSGKRKADPRRFSKNERTNQTSRKRESLQLNRKENFATTSAYGGAGEERMKNI